MDFDFSALEGLQRFSINNLGDPFIDSNYGVHSREFEVRILLALLLTAMISNSKDASELMWEYSRGCLEVVAF